MIGLTIVVSCVVAFFGLSRRELPENQAQKYYEHGVVLAAQHDYAKADVELRNALRIKNDMLEAWRVLANIEEATQRWGDLIQSLQSIVSLSPSDVDARIRLVKLLAVSGRVYQALELINAGDEADGQNAAILGLKSAVLYKLNDKRGAVREAQKALAIDGGNADALVVLANEKMASGDLKDALQVLDKGASASNTDLGIQLLRLKIFEQSGEARQFELLLRQLAELHPKDGVFRKQLIKFYVDQHRTDDAEKEARALVQENLANPDAELELVRLLYAAKGPACGQAGTHCSYQRRR